MKRIGILVIMAFALSLVSASTVFAKRDEEINKALKYYGNKKYQEVVKTLEGYVAQKPDPVAYYLMGYSLYKLKKFDEANKYFEEAYAVDPEFSLEKAGLLPKQAAVQPAEKAAAAEQKEQAPAKTEAAAQPAAKPAETKPAAQKPAEPAKPGAAPQTATAPQTAPAPAAPAAPAPAPSQQAAPQPKPSFPAPPAGTPSFPMPKDGMPPEAAGGLMAIVAGAMIFFLIIELAIYIYTSLCLFLIAKKLNVPAPWTAFIPLVNLWTIVACAGKPAWWIVLFIVPFVNLFVILYLPICITENLGRNKWLGLLLFVPIVNLIFLGMLAFSKSESGSMSVEEAV